MGYVNTTEKLKLPQWRWIDHPDFVPDINEAFAAIDKYARESGGDYDTLKRQVESLSTNFVEIQEGFTRLSEKVDNLEDLENNPEFIKVVNSVNALNTQVVNLEESVTNNTGDITELQTKVSILESETASIKNNIDTINRTLADHSTRIEDLESTSTTQSGNITELETRLSTAETNIEANETAIDNVNTRVNTTNSKVASVETRLEETNNNIATVTARVGTLESSQTTQDEKITALETSQAAQDLKIEGLETANENTSSTIEQHTAKLAELEEADNTINGRVENVETKNTSQDTEISALEARVDAIETQPETIGTDVVGGCYCELNNGNSGYIVFTVYRNGCTSVYLHGIPYTTEETSYLVTRVYNTSGIINGDTILIGNTTVIYIPLADTNLTTTITWESDSKIKNLKVIVVSNKITKTIRTIGAFNMNAYLARMTMPAEVTADLSIEEFMRDLRALEVNYNEFVL